MFTAVAIFERLRLGGRQPVRTGQLRISRIILGAALALLASLLVTSLANAAMPRSYFQLAVIIIDRSAPRVDFNFWLDSPYSSSDQATLNETMAKTVDITAMFGPELTYQGTSEFIGHADDVRGDQWFNISTMMTRTSTKPIFTTVNVTVVYTDLDGARHRTIYRSLTFALNYVAPPVPVNLAAAAAAGLGSAGVLGLGLYAIRRARLEELYLMHDSDIISGMLIVLQEFVRDSFDDRRGSLEQLRFGQRQVLMVRGSHTVLAAVILGRYVNGLPRKLQIAVWEFERSHWDILSKWDGNLALLPQADAIAHRFMRPRLRFHPN